MSKVFDDEAHWLKSSYFTNNLAKLEHIVKTASEACAPTETIASGATLALTTQNEDSVKGFVTLNGHLVTKCDLHIKFNALNRGHTVKLQLDPTKHLILEPLLNCKNYLYLATNCFRDFDSKKGFHKHLHVLQANLIKAKSNLVGPKNEIQVDRSAFLNMPENLELSFSIVEANIVAKLYLMRKNELLFSSQVETIIPSVSTTLTVIEHALDICAEIDRKLRITRN